MPASCQELLAEGRGRESLSLSLSPLARRRIRRHLYSQEVQKRNERGRTMSRRRRTHYYKLPAIRSRKKVPFSFMEEEEEERKEGGSGTGNIFEWRLFSSLLVLLLSPPFFGPLFSRTAESQNQEGRGKRRKNLVESSEWNLP